MAIESSAQAGTAFNVFLTRLVPQTACGASDPKDKGTKIVPPQPKHVAERGVAVADALETTAVDTKKERLVCLPAS